MPSVTISRDDAVQRCPVEKYAPCTAQLTAVARSASSRITSGFLPPISSWTFAIRAIAFAAMLRPVSTEPVKLMPATSGLVTIVSPTTEPRPITRLNTPAGKPAFARISAIAHAQPGTRSAGFMTTVLPYASAGAIFHAGIAIGKFHGVMRPMTPSGSRVISTSTPGRTDGSFLAGEAQRLAGEELEDVAGAHRLADAFGQRLAFLAREEPPELVLAREDLVAGAIEDVRALLDVAAAPRPGNACFAAAIAVARLRGVGLRVFADHVGQIGRIPVERRGRAGDPLAGDEVAKGAGGHRMPSVGLGLRARRRSEQSARARDCA